MQLTKKQKIIILTSVLIVAGIIIIIKRKEIKKIAEESAIKTKTFIKEHIYSAINKIHLNNLHDSVKNIFTKFVSEIEKMGYIVRINSSYRSFAKQYDLYKKYKEGKMNVPVASPGSSYHNYGMAIDIYIYDKNNREYNEKTPKSEWEKTGVPSLAKKMGITWGGNFKDNIHFDYRLLPINKLKELAINQFGNIKNVEGNKITIT